MKLEKAKLDSAIEAGIITREQADALWLFWKGDQDEEYQGEAGSSRTSRFLYYLGALIVIGAMGWLMNRVWDSFAGAGLFATAAIYALGFLAAARYTRTRSTVLSGLLVVMAVSMTPLGVYGLQKWAGIWPHENPGAYRNFYYYIKGGWFTMEIATLIASIAALRFSRIPFATAPLALVLWFMSMDVTPLIFGNHSWMDHKRVSLCFGLAMLLVALRLDGRTRVDYAKWLYIFGTMTFWGGLSLIDSGSQLSRFFYALLNVFMMFSGLLLERKVLIVFGGIGFFGYLGNLSWTIFKDSFLFPIALTALGLSIVYSGWLYHKKQDRIRALALTSIPDFILHRLPSFRE